MWDSSLFVKRSHNLATLRSTDYCVFFTNLFCGSGSVKKPFSLLILANDSLLTDQLRLPDKEAFVSYLGFCPAWRSWSRGGNRPRCVSLTWFPFSCTHLRLTETHADRSSVHTSFTVAISGEAIHFFSLQQVFPWISLGGLVSGTHKQGKWKRENIIRGTFQMKWTREDIKRDRTCAAFWGGIRFDPLRNNYVRFADGASHSFIHHKLWTLFPSLAFLSVISWAYPLCWALLFISRAVW